MIRYTTGNILESQAEALVNPVNCVGVMGAGLAKQFKEAFPQNFRDYAWACREGHVDIGHVHLHKTNSLVGPRYIINFPTKRHWRDASRFQWIKDGLADLSVLIESYGIRSIAVPALGCGLGGLEWFHVRKLIESHLGVIDNLDVIVYKPQEEEDAGTD